MFGSPIRYETVQAPNKLLIYHNIYQAAAGDATGSEQETISLELIYILIRVPSTEAKTNRARTINFTRKCQIICGSISTRRWSWLKIYCCISRYAGISVRRDRNAAFLPCNGEGYHRHRCLSYRAFYFHYNFFRKEDFHYSLSTL